MVLQRLRDPSTPRTRLDPRLEAAYLCIALMETMWIAPWFATLVPGTQNTPFPLIMLYVSANVLIPLVIVRLLDTWGMRESLRQVVFLAGMILAAAWSAGVIFPQEAAAPIMENIGAGDALITRLTVPPVLVILGVVALLWWRGLRVALVTPTATRAAFGMRFGILGFVLAAVLLYEKRDLILTALPPFFFFGLLATSLARAVSLRAIYRQPVSFGPTWTGFMAAAAAGVTVIGLLVGALLSGADPEALAQIVQPLIAIPVLIVGLLLTPIFLIIEAIIAALVPLLMGSGILGNVLQTPELAPPNQQGQEQLPDFLQQIQRFLNALGGIQTCITVVVVLLVAAIVLLTLRQRRQSRLLADEEREDLEGDLMGGLRDAFRRGMQALNSMLNAVGQFGLGRNLFAALTVRRVYAQMASLAAKRGHPRTPSETPYEYRAPLGKAYPALENDVGLITEAYVRVHYGEAPENAEALRQVVEAWGRLKESPEPTK